MREEEIDYMDWYDDLRKKQEDAIEGAVYNGNIKALVHIEHVTPELLKPELLFLAHDAKMFCYLAKEFPEALKLDDEDGVTPTHIAAKYARINNSIEALELIEKMAPETFEKCDCSGRTPAHYAINEAYENIYYSGNLYRAAIDYIASKHPKSMTQTDWRGNTPLYLLARAEVYAKSRKAELQAEEYDAYRKACNAIKEGSVKDMFISIKYHYPKILELCTKDDKPLFHFAAEKSVKAFCFLIEKTPTGLFMKDARGAFPAHYAPIGATLCKSLEGIKLIEKYAPMTMTAIDMYNETPTSIAAHWADKNQCEVFNYLAEKYPNTLYIKPMQSKETPFEVAKRKHIDIPKQTQGEKEL